jgi:hypothetical protein
MDWSQALTVIGVFIGGFIYLISKIDTNQKENNTRFNGIENRLTALEVEIKNIQQRLSTIEGYLIPKKIYRIEKPSREEPKEN